jgi:hypothetical protein
MKSFLSFLLLPALAAGADRDLQKIPTTLDGICTLLLGNVFDSVLGTVERVTCSCTPVLFPSVSFTLECESTEPACLPNNLVCGIPSASVSFELEALRAGELPVSYDVCFTEIYILNNIPVIEVLGPWCLSLALTLIDTLNGNSAQEATVSDCTATMSGAECNSCGVCNGGDGVIFDCTEVVGGLETTTCAAMNLPTNIRDIAKVDTIVEPPMD